MVFHLRLPLCHLSYFSGSVLLSVLTLFAPAQSQVVADDTLPNGTVVNADGTIRRIEGGTRSGENLFHSFEQFSIPTETSVQFQTAGAENVLSRVTGESISDIDGEIRVDGSANLFLINPNGIVFGPHAELNIGGSFLASTAERLEFADGSTFRATEPQDSPLLTVSAPIGLGFEGNPGDIRVLGSGHNLTRALPVSDSIQRNPASTGLTVPSRQTLALVGGDVTLEGGNLSAAAGRVELGGIASGQVRWSTPTAGEWSLNFDRVTSFRDLLFLRQSSIDTSGPGAGSIALNGRQIGLTGGSVALVQTAETAPGGNLTVNATQLLKIAGTAPDLSIRSGLFNETVGSGRGGDIRIAAPEVIVDAAGAIYTTTFGGARGGNLTVTAPDSIQVAGFSPQDPQFFSLMSAAAYGSGRAGNIRLNSGQLQLLEGGAISSITFGEGSGGELAIDTSESVEVIGGIKKTPFRPSILATTALATGNAGRLTVDTRRIVVLDGARIDSSTFAAGGAGTVNLDASDSVEVRGFGSGAFSPSAILSSANRLDPLLQKIFGLPAIPKGDAGSVTVSTSRMTVTDEALVNVSADGPGDAGDIRISADSILIDRKGGIEASTQAGDGGNIFIDNSDVLLLRRGSQISAEAEKSGMGGNIEISAKFVAALPQENSDITADAIEGRGGKISLRTSGLFGIEPREEYSPLSDINASSEFGVDGTVDIRTLELDPSRGLVELPTNLVDPTQSLARRCSLDEGEYTREANRFAIVGRGGLPVAPEGQLTSERIMTSWVSRQPFLSQADSSPPEVRKNFSPVAAEIVEAQGWAVRPNGQVTLIARPPTTNSHKLVSVSRGCQES
jgi:filamentous hemagglutinin family protein